MGNFSATWAVVPLRCQLLVPSAPLLEPTLASTPSACLTTLQARLSHLSRSRHSTTSQLSSCPAHPRCRLAGRSCICLILTWMYRMSFPRTQITHSPAVVIRPTAWPAWIYTSVVEHGGRTIDYCSDY